MFENFLTVPLLVPVPYLYINLQVHTRYIDIRSDIMLPLKMFQLYFT